MGFSIIVFSKREEAYIHRILREILLIIDWEDDFFVIGAF
jgi:hypothetical protein